MIRGVGAAKVLWQAALLSIAAARGVGDKRLYLLSHTAPLFQTSAVQFVHQLPPLCFVTDLLRWSDIC